MATHLFLSLLLLLLSSAASAAHHRHRHTAAAAEDQASKIRQACAATRYTDVCLASLSNSTLPPSPTHLDLIAAAFNATAADLETARSTAQSILSSSNDPNRTNAAQNCVDLLRLSSLRLSSSSPAALPDALAWSSAALLYQYDCWSALKYVNTSQAIADAMSFVLHLTNLTSNSLSMLASLNRYGPDTSLWAPPQTERDGYWGGAAAGGAGGGGSAAAAFPSGDAPNATVCLSGCAYTTVQSAVDAAPNGSRARFVIRINEGVYSETVRVPYEKTNLVFIGDGMGKTVITGGLNAGMVGVSTYNTATVGVTGDGFMARDLTFRNTAGPDAHQAVAFRSDSDLSVLLGVEFDGHQDTLYAHGLRQYYKGCKISGTVDFIFGNAAAVFDRCEVVVVPRQLDPEKGEKDTVTAHGRTDPAQATGFVLSGCVVNGSAEYVAEYRRKPAKHKVYLGRPWKEYSRTVAVGCELGEVVAAEGWLEWTGDFALATLFYGEHGSTGPGGDVTHRVPWSSQVPAEHVGLYTAESFIQGASWIPSDLLS